MLSVWHSLTFGCWWVLWMNTPLSIVIFFSVSSRQCWYFRLPSKLRDISGGVMSGVSGGDVSKITLIIILSLLSSQWTFSRIYRHLSLHRPPLHCTALQYLLVDVITTTDTVYGESQSHGRFQIDRENDPIAYSRYCYGRI